ncbi:MAG: RMD1 family protein [Gammaproteobacteria bacterium]|nr:RMD1 family protein [Gammaproteobacteria bacterium]
MNQQLFSGQHQLTVRALFLGQRLELRHFKNTQPLSISPLTITAGANGCAMLYRYGAVVMMGLNSVEEMSLLAELEDLVVDPFTEVEDESINLILSKDDKEGIDASTIYLHDFELSRVQLVAYILAKSVVLAHYEKVIADSFDQIEPLASSLKERGRGQQGSRHLVKYIGDILYIQGKMVGRVEVTEKPELLWERPELERLYLRLEDEFELHERHVALERKLELISRTAVTLLDLLQTNRSLRVEWYIVILIVIDILINLPSHFL